MTRTGRVVLRKATIADASAMYALIANEEHLMPRSQSDLVRCADRFVVAVRRGEVVACAELAPLSDQLAEVRSLVVHSSLRRRGVGTRLIQAIHGRATRAGFDRLCALTQTPAYFLRRGFSVVPHLSLTEKVTTDCVRCSRFGSCGQVPLVLRLEAAAAPSVSGRTLFLHCA